MKKDLKLSKWMLCVSTGALLYTASLVYGNDPAAGRQSEQQQSQQSQSYQSTESSAESQSLEVKSEESAQGVEISEPAGAERPRSQVFSGEKHAQAAKEGNAQQASFGTLERTSDLIGREIRTEQGEKLGDIKDVMIDLQSGRIPFAVLSSGGIAGIGDRLLAIPPTALSAESGEDAFVLSMSQDQLRNAPTFQRNQWPDRMDQQWSANVYQFYGQQPYWQTTGYRSTSDYRTRSFEQESQIREPSGAEASAEFHSSEMYEPSGATYYESKHVTRYPKTILGDNNTMDDINQGSGTRGGAEDLNDFDEKANASKDAISEYYGSHHGEYRSYGTAYGPSSSTILEPSAAGRADWERGDTRYGTTTTREEQRHTKEFRNQQHSTKQPMRSHMGGAKLHRSSDLVGLNVKNAQGETIGEIKDVVIDMKSGRVAYVAFEGSGAFDRGDQWLAVPASMFSGMEQRQVTLNVTPDRLNNAPTFEEGSWEEATSEEFVSRIYTHYGQQPYWRSSSSSSSFQEPAGTPREQFQQEQHQEFKQEKTETEVESIEEPSGAEKPHSQDLNQSELESPEREISEPSGAELKSESSIEGQSSTPSTESAESSAQLEQQEQASAPSAGVDVSAQAGQSGVDVSAQAGASEEQAGAQISEQAGAEAEAQNQSLESQPAESSAATQVTEPAGASTEQSTQQSTELESQQVDQSQVSSEAAGAATSADQTGSARLVENVRTELNRDTAAGAQNIQVTTEQGKIVLKGTVNSEADKQRIEEKVQNLIIDNQLQVKGGTSPSQP